MIIRNFRPSDLDDIRAMEPYMEVVEGWEEVVEHSITLTAEHKGVPIACGGVVVGERAMFWARTDGTHKFKVFRGLKEGLRILVKALGDMEYYALILDGFTKGRMLAERLGFERTDTTVEHDNHIYHRYKLWV